MKTEAFFLLLGPILMLNLADRIVPERTTEADGAVEEEVCEYSCARDESDSVPEEESLSAVSGEEGSVIRRFNDRESAFHSRLREREQKLSQFRSREKD